MKVYLEIRVENTFEVEVPDGLTEEEAYQYILDNYQDEIGLAINGGDFCMEVLGTDENVKICSTKLGKYYIAPTKER